MSVAIGSPGLVLTPWTAEVTRLGQSIVWRPDVQEIRVERHWLLRTIVRLIGQAAPESPPPRGTASTS